MPDAAELQLDMMERRAAATAEQSHVDEAEAGCCLRIPFARPSPPRRRCFGRRYCSSARWPAASRSASACWCSGTSSSRPPYPRAHTCRGVWRLLAAYIDHRRYRAGGRASRAACASAPKRQASASASQPTLCSTLTLAAPRLMCAPARRLITERGDHVDQRSAR